MSRNILESIKVTIVIAAQISHYFIRWALVETRAAVFRYGGLNPFAPHRAVGIVGGWINANAPTCEPFNPDGLAGGKSLYIANFLGDGDLPLLGHVGDHGYYLFQ